MSETLLCRPVWWSCLVWLHGYKSADAMTIQSVRVNCIRDILHQSSKCKRPCTVKRIWAFTTSSHFDNCCHKRLYSASKNLPMVHVKLTCSYNIIWHMAGRIRHDMVKDQFSNHLITNTFTSHPSNKKKLVKSKCSQSSSNSIHKYSLHRQHSYWILQI